MSTSKATHKMMSNTKIDWVDGSGGDIGGGCATA